MGRVLFATVLLAGMLYGTNSAASPGEKPLAIPEESSAKNDSAAGPAIDKPFQVAAIDYCFAGSVLDPSTGETVELFVLCEEDGVEQNMDLA